MGILDDAIREHLELKRQHGAEETELARQEAEALGPARREPAAQTIDPGEPPPTEALAPPDPEAAIGESAGAPPPPPPEAIEPMEAPVADFAPPPADDVLHAEPAMEDPVAPPPAEDSFAEPRAAEAPFADDPLAEDPLAEGPLPGEDAFPATQAMPASELPAPPAPEEDDDLFADPLAERALPPDEPAGAAEPGDLEPPEEFDHDEATRVRPLPPVDDEGMAPAPALPPEPAYEPEPDFSVGSGEPAAPADGDEDVLEETPDFLQDTPEHDRLWFEQKPPRDFDFDD